MKPALPASAWVTSCIIAGNCVSLKLQLPVVSTSLVPRPSSAPVFDRLQYAKMDPEGLVNLTMWPAARTSHFVTPYRYGRAAEKTDLTFCTRYEDEASVIMHTKHIRARRHSSKGLPNDLSELSYSWWQNLANVAKRSCFWISNACSGTILQQFCFKLGNVLQVGLNCHSAGTYLVSPACL